MSVPVLLAQSGVEQLPEDLGAQPFWVHVVRVLLAFLIALIGTALLTWGERRIIAKMQSRYGPNRLGPLGVFQVLADGVKMFFKEDVRPNAIDPPLYYIAPIILPITNFLVMAVVPFGGRVTLFGETFDLQVFDPDIGILWFLAMGSIHVYGVVIAGWASGSAYPLLGGVRATAQLISYEIALGLAAGAVFVYTGSLRVSEIVAQQAGPGLVAGIPNWNVIPLFPAFLLFLVALTAEAARPPFDLPEAEGELVAGYHTEYSGIKFGMFQLGEFMGVITSSAILITMFFGGPAGPVWFAEQAWARWFFPIFWFLAKLLVFVVFFVLLRATLPRMRYDRLMTLGWRFLLPVGLLWVLATGFMVIVNTQLDARARTTVAIGGVAGALLLYLLAPLFGRGATRTFRRPLEDERTFGDTLDDERVGTP